MLRITYDEVVCHKQLSAEKLVSDLKALRRYAANENARCFAGNPTLYHFQMDNLCRTRIQNKKSLYDIMTDDSAYAKLLRNAQSLNRTGSLANRLFEANRFNNAVVFFKATTAKYLYKKFGATKVLDPTAGWGGRMLGAWALGINYVGIDTNVALQGAYSRMMAALPPTGSSLQMIWQSCLDVDFSKLDYDFVLTSPPYINLELYENMTPFESKAAFYTAFLIPLLTKCLKNIRRGGRVCFNISPQMYADLLEHGFRACDEEEDLLQQKRMGKNKGDKIYIWIRRGVTAAELREAAAARRAAAALTPA
jgi:hypothetical protein